jgi:asparaginyl-tRNA synthetase
MRRWRPVVFPRRVPPQIHILSRHVHYSRDSFNRTPINDLLGQSKNSAVPHDTATTVVCGWVKSVRRQKNISFVAINDGSSLQNLQVVCDSKKISSENVDRLSVGSSVKVTGDITRAPKSGQVEVQATDVHVFGTSDASTYPLSKKYHSLEFVREHLHLRPRTNTFGALTRVRNALRYTSLQRIHFI